MTPNNAVFYVDWMVSHSAHHYCLIECSNNEHRIMSFYNMSHIINTKSRSTKKTNLRIKRTRPYFRFINSRAKRSRTLSIRSRCLSSAVTAFDGRPLCFTEKRSIMHVQIYRTSTKADNKSTNHRTINKGEWTLNGFTISLLLTAIGLSHLGASNETDVSSSTVRCLNVASR
jgi:hypothetical protein